MPSALPHLVLAFHWLREQIPLLIRYLGDEDETVSYVASNSLIGLGDFSIGPLVTAFETEDGNIKTMSGRLLEHIGVDLASLGAA